MKDRTRQGLEVLSFGFSVFAWAASIVALALSVYVAWAIQEYIA